MNRRGRSPAKATRIGSRMALIILLGCPCAAQEAFGTWKMDPARSILDSSDTRALTVRIESHPKGEVFTVERLRRNGQTETWSAILYMDGKPRDSPRLDCPGTLASRRLENSSVELLWSCENDRVMRSIRHTPSNTNHLILDETESRPNHPDQSRHIVLQRQRPTGN